MATLSEPEIIQSKPIAKGLDAFRDAFQLTCADLGVPASADSVQQIIDKGAKDLVLDLILAFQGLRTTNILPSRNGRGTLAGDLSSFYSRLDSNQQDISSVTLLLRKVVDNAADADIWNAVYDLVAQTTPLHSPKAITPPAAFEKADFDTPFRSNSTSQSGTEQTHEKVDQRILEELTKRVYYDVGGFYERYFEGKVWTNNAKDIYDKSRAQYAEGRWNGWPEPALQDPFFEWFMKFWDTALSGLHRKYYTSANRVLSGSEADRKLDIFLARSDATFLDGEHDWSNVLVIGEHKSNLDEDRSIKTLIQLAGYAREVFGSQPDRRFVPGFTICGSMMRLWVFDRSGPYNSMKFDIHKEPERFVNVLAGYALMSDAELGLNTFIKHDENGKYIVARDVRISLEDKPIASTKAIVCRGTTCYRGRRPISTDWEYVVKFAWPSDLRQQEGRLLKLAKERGVTGVAEWFHHEQISMDGDPDTISHLRRGMIFAVPRKLSKKASWVGGGAVSSWMSRITSLRGRPRSSVGRLTGLRISTTISCSGQKRKRDDGFVEGRAMKRSKFDGSNASATNVRKEDQLDAIGAPSIQETVVDSLADCRNEWQRNNVDSIQEAGTDSLTYCESETYGNRVHYCLVSSPAGRPLHEYRSVEELIEALRDAIAGHRSLFEDGRILHRDISENNIIITNHAVEGDPKGRLIDLDLAKELDSGPSGANYRTGTMQFMAIEVLDSKGHTYRHDLESMFYVFIWICTRYGSNRQRLTKTGRLQGWYIGTYTEIARNKLGDMDKNGFEKVIAEFTPNFESLKQLARELRNVLFPIRDGAIFIGTFRDSGIMYNGMIEAFDRAINLIQEAEANSLAGQEIELYDNRVHYCLVSSPAGRPLHEYRSVKELLEALRDAIIGHRSLFEDGRILHQDISENNIIITNHAAEGDPKGRLIDLDLAKELDSGPSGANYRTGTMQFMAIEVLQGKGHTYRHDLESMFYVFIWICTRYGSNRQRLTKIGRLQGWYTRTYTEIARIKLGDMDKTEFENVIVEFTPTFESLKQLARELRNVLFPIRDGAMFRGTFRDSGIMYNGMIEAFNRAIDRLGEEEQAIA